MSRARIIGAVALSVLALSLSACDLKSKGDNAAQAGPPAGGPPPLPPYQMRAEVADGNRLAPIATGEALFSKHCGACHLAAGMGTNLITGQQIAAGNSPDKGLLANRDDLTADYVKAVARNGKNAMPRQTRVDITDAELDKVAAFLGKGK